MALDTPYRYVNVAGAWPGARLDGLLAGDDGRLRLPPGPDGVAEVVALSIDPAGGFVGIAAAPDGTLYVADPGGGRVLRVDPCDGHVRTLGCLERASGDPAAPQGPRGLALGPRGSLVVADPQTARVLVVDRATGAPLAVWSDGFVTPWAVAVDDEDRVLVADPGAHALRRFSIDGEEDLAYATAAAGAVQAPRALLALAGGAVLVVDGDERVLVLDPAGAADRAATAAYAPLDAGATLALAQAGATTWAAGAHGAGALAGGALERRDEPAAAGVAIACDGRVLFATPTAIVTLVPGATAIHGTIVVPAPPGLLPWDRVRVVLAEPLARETHVRVWTRADAAAPAPPAPVAGDEPEAPLPTPAQTWRAAPLDVLDVRPLVAAAQALWIAVELHGDGSASPVVDDVRVDRTGRGWLADLPHALVDADEDPLTRVLALLASVYEDVAGAIDALPGRLDPAIAPDRRDAPWVARLARWVDVEPAARLDEAQRRALVRDAVALHERRGTVRGIVDAVRRDVGVEVTIVEPAPAPAWTLGQGGGALAGGAALGAAPAGPPVLDTTAIVDRSWLVDDGERGLALLAGSAHRFCVLAPADALRDPGSRAAIERVVEREKPSHTVFELGTPETASASGASRVGIDRLVDRADAALRLDGADRLGSGTVLMGQQATDKPAPGRVGKTTVVGASHPERTRP